MSETATIQPDIAMGFAAVPLPAGGVVWFAARHSGLSRSDDGGGSWAAVASAGAGPITAVAASPDLAVDRTLFVGAAGGVLRSTDLGETWQRAPLGVLPPVVSALAVSPDFGRDGVVLAGTVEDGVYRSSDGGLTWRAANVGLFDMSVLAITLSPGFASDQLAVLGVSSGVYVSESGGRSWLDVAGPDAAAVTTIAAWSAPGADLQCVAGTEGDGLFRSVDGGKTWCRMTSVPSATDIVRTHVSASAGNEPDLLIVATDGVTWSPDGGAAWTRLETSLPPGDQIVSALPWDQAGAMTLMLGLASGAIHRLELPNRHGR